MKKSRAKFKIHYTDNYGQATIDCYDIDDFQRMQEVLKDDPECEHYDQEHGWEEI